jgi:hypothetical protein
MLSRFAVVAIVVAVVACFCGSAVTASEPAFCNGLSCPAYNVTFSAGTDFEVRKYAASTWVSTTIANASITSTDAYHVALETGFERLFKYISGENAAKLKIAMTAPVETRITPGAGPACDTEFTISFFMDPVVATHLPDPVDATLFVDRRGETTLAVSQFGGFANKYEEVQNRILALITETQKRGYSFDAAHQMVAQYNSPFTIVNRHNEIWLTLV